MKQSITITIDFDVPANEEVYTTQQAISDAKTRILDGMVANNTNGKGYFTLISGNFEKRPVEYNWRIERG